MTQRTWIESVRASSSGRRLFERERVWIEATEVLCRLMEAQGVSSQELARRLDVSPARISQLLSGTRNLTLTTLADAFHALGRSMHIRHGPPTERAIVGMGSARSPRGSRGVGGPRPRKSGSARARGRRHRDPAG